MSRLGLWGETMPTLRNAKHERFAQERATGSKLCDAYLAAGYSGSRTQATRHGWHSGPRSSRASPSFKSEWLTRWSAMSPTTGTT